MAEKRCGRTGFGINGQKRGGVYRLYRLLYDRPLCPYDSIAHCRMLAKVGVITHEEANGLVEGLGTIKRELDRGEFPFDDSLEDIHMHIEARLLQVAGKVAQKLHTARSRNDQVALDVRMYLRDETHRTIDLRQTLRTVLVDLANGHRNVDLPGYTHTQRAQPVLFAHHMMAYYEMFTRDQTRFSDCLEWINVIDRRISVSSDYLYRKFDQSARQM